MCVNEAAAQLCFMMPTLLTRRDELFPLARQIVRDSGYQYSKGHSRSQFQQGFPSKLFSQSNTTIISSTNGGGKKGYMEKRTWVEGCVIIGSGNERLTGNGEKLTYSPAVGCNWLCLAGV